MGISTYDIINFIVTYKWWIIAAIPFVIAIQALRARG